MSDSAIIAKSRAVFGKLLKKEDYENLIQRNSVSAAVSYLKGTQRYREVFAGSDPAALHRGQVEYALGKVVFDTYSRIRRFSPKRGGVMDFYLKSEETEQLCCAIAAVSTGTQERFYLSLPDHLLDLLSFPEEEAARAKNPPELLAALSGTAYYKPLKPYLSEKEMDVNKCVSVLHSCYLGWVFTQLGKEYKGKQLEELKQFFLRKADSENVLRCYRLKRFFDADRDRIHELMLPYRYRVKPQEIDEALSAADPSQSLIELLSKRCTPKNIMVDPDFPETGLARADHRFFRDRLALADNGAEALYALVVLLENERTNLQKIIEGIRYSLPPQEIEKYVII